PNEHSGVTPLVLPARSPNLDAFAERFVQSMKSECVDRMVLLGERHLWAAAREFVHHHHEERPHQGSATNSSRRNGTDSPNRGRRNALASAIALASQMATGGALW